MPRVFLSHSSKDKPIARKIAFDLRRAGVDVWLDEWEIRVGHAITQKIQEGLENSEFVAVLLSKYSVLSGWVEKEWQSKIGEEAVSRKVLVLPLKLDDCKIPILLRDKKYADFSGDYRIAIESLFFAIKTLTLTQRVRKGEKGHIGFEPVDSYDLLTPALAWLAHKLQRQKWVIPLSTPRRNGLKLNELYRRHIRKEDQRNLVRLPWGPMLALQPDIAGAIELSHSNRFGWVIAMVYPWTLFEYDVIQAHFIIDSSSAALGFVFWDMNNGFTRDGYDTLLSHGTSYTGIGDDGHDEHKTIKYIMYSRKEQQFVDGLEASLVIAHTLADRL